MESVKKRADDVRWWRCVDNDDDNDVGDGWWRYVDNDNDIDVGDGIVDDCLTMSQAEKRNRTLQVRRFDSRTSSVFSVESSTM